MSTTRILAFSATLFATVCVSAPAFADWDPTQPAKWVQPPDTTPWGLDVFNSFTEIPGAVPFGKVLADDFLCRSPGPITDIHIWGSWLGDRLPADPIGLPNPANVAFKLSIHADIPKGPDVPYSRPGPALWETVVLPGAFQVRPWGPPLPEGEGFFDPNSGQWARNADKQIWQYNFFIDPAVAFHQKGTEAQPIVYWLDVLAFPHDPTAVFGWKSANPEFRWNDDAVFGDVPQFGVNVPVEPWRDLHYPEGHPLQGQSLDLAFVITPEPASLGLLAVGSLMFLRRRR